MDSLLEETIFGGNEAITAGLLSRKAQVTIQDARKAMEVFYKNSKTALSASFVVSGLKGGHDSKCTVFKLVEESNIELTKQELKGPVSVDIYAVGPNNVTDEAILANLAHSQRAADAQLTLEDLEKIGFIVNPLVSETSLRTAYQKPGVCQVPVKQELPAEVKKEPKEPAKPKEAKPREAVKPKAAPKSKSPFARISKEEAVAKAFDRRPNQTAVAEKVVVADDVDDVMEVDSDSEEQRKKLETLFDDDSMQVDSEPEEPDEPEEPEPQEVDIANEDEPNAETTPQAEPEPEPEFRKGRKKVTQRRHYEDDEGNLVTKTEEVWVSCDEEEEEPIQPKPAPKPAPASKPLPKIPKRTTQQATLMNFFSKKA